MNKEKSLDEQLIEAMERQLALPMLIEDARVTFDAAFVNEKEIAFKSTDSLAKARARSRTGDLETRYKYEFEAITNEIKVLIFRISQASQKQQ